MSEQRSRRKPVLVFLLFLLSFSRWMFYTFIFGTSRSDPMLYAELGFFFLFYTLAVFDLPPFAISLTAMLGCAAICGGHLLTQFDNQINQLQVLIYAPALVFFCVQYEACQKSAGGLFSALMNLCSALLLPAQLAADLYLVRNTQDFFKSSSKYDITYITVITLLLAALYLFVFYTARKNSPKGMKQSELHQFHFSYIFAAGSMLLSIPLSLSFVHSQTAFTAFILWLLDLLMLVEKNNPLLVSFVSRVKKKREAFLADDAS